MSARQLVELGADCFAEEAFELVPPGGFFGYFARDYKAKTGYGMVGTFEVDEAEALSSNELAAFFDGGEFLAREPGGFGKHKELSDT